MTRHYSFNDPAYRETGFQLLPFRFEEQEISPGVLCQGTAHFTTDRFGGWSIDYIEMKGWHGPDVILSDKSHGFEAVLWTALTKHLRDHCEDHILGNLVLEG